MLVEPSDIDRHLHVLPQQVEDPPIELVTPQDREQDVVVDAGVIARYVRFERRTKPSKYNPRKAKSDQWAHYSLHN